MGATIKTLATNDDIASVISELRDAKAYTKVDVYLLGWPGRSNDRNSDALSKKITSFIVEGAIKNLATKDDIIAAKDDIAMFKYDLSKEIGNSVKWMFIFWMTQVRTILTIVFPLLKK